jgi:hypothetical protein
MGTTSSMTSIPIPGPRSGSRGRTEENHSNGTLRTYGDFARPVRLVEMEPTTPGAPSGRILYTQLPKSQELIRIGPGLRAYRDSDEDALILRAQKPFVKNGRVRATTDSSALLYPRYHPANPRAQVWVYVRSRLEPDLQLPSAAVIALL